MILQKKNKKEMRVITKITVAAIQAMNNRKLRRNWIEITGSLRKRMKKMRK